MKKITIGARGSKLSLAYADRVRKKIIEKNNDLNESDIVILPIKTSGDLYPNKKISEIGGKNLFCKEIEENLLNEKINLAVHSLKDMECNEHKDLIIGAYIERTDPSDVILSNKIKNLKDLKTNVVIGSSSKRREYQLKLLNNKISVKYLRGNIDTRIKKLESEKIDGIILAAAGVKSINLEKKISITFDTNKFLPAVGQGIIAVQCRRNDNLIKSYLDKINHKETSLCALSERNMLRAIGGDCETAIGGLAQIKNNILNLKAQLFSDDGSVDFIYELEGNESDAVDIGQKVGEELLRLAGSKFKKK